MKLENIGSSLSDFLEEEGITLQTMQKAANCVGKKLEINLVTTQGVDEQR